MNEYANENKICEEIIDFLASFAIKTINSTRIYMEKNNNIFTKCIYSFISLKSYNIISSRTPIARSRDPFRIFIYPYGPYAINCKNNAV